MRGGGFGRVRCAATLGVCLFAAAASAGSLTVTVLGSDGRPVKDAVVSLDAVAVTGAPGATPLQPAVVDQRGKRFDPWVTAVRKGAPVSFENHDDITHHVYSISPAKHLSFRLQAGEHEGPVPFDATGVVVLGCNIHDWMVGYVFVTDSAYFGVTGADGQVRFARLPAGGWKLHLWHPGLEEDAAHYDRDLELGADQQHSEQLRLHGKLRETGPRQPLDESGYR